MSRQDVGRGCRGRRIPSTPPLCMHMLWFPRECVRHCTGRPGALVAPTQSVVRHRRGEKGSALPPPFSPLPRPLPPPALAWLPRRGPLVHSPPPPPAMSRPLPLLFHGQAEGDACHSERRCRATSLRLGVWFCAEQHQQTDSACPWRCSIRAPVNRERCGGRASWQLPQQVFRPHRTWGRARPTSQRRSLAGLLWRKGKPFVCEAFSEAHCA